MIYKKILLVSSFVVASLITSCSAINPDAPAETKKDPQTSDNPDDLAGSKVDAISSYDPDGPAGFKADPENFTGYLNSLDWGKGKKVVFSHLDKCREKIKEGVYFDYSCRYGFVFVNSPVEDSKCEISKVSITHFFPGYEKINPSLISGLDKRPEIEYRCK